ncbi:hypothetical protein [Bacillus massiliglaciei]|uniref:hypothetical protein n=1 Tax=Bacillus massiliglaciei TaxID=1816693 RepID=UPI000DA5EE7F|nr:hypothetical protein [Bacillus massiliglaciei]
MKLKSVKKLTAGAILASSFGLAVPAMADEPTHNDRNQDVKAEHFGHKGHWGKHQFNPLEKLKEGDQFAGLTVASVTEENDTKTVGLSGSITVKGFYDEEDGTLKVIPPVHKYYHHKGFKSPKPVEVAINNPEALTGTQTEGEEDAPEFVTLSNITVVYSNGDYSATADAAAAGETK